ARPARLWPPSPAGRRTQAGPRSSPSAQMYRSSAYSFLSTASAAHRDAIHAQRWLANADRHALTILATGADSRIEREVVADHCDAMKVGRSVADQHHAFQRCAELAVLDAIGLGALEHVFARGDVDLAAAEIR